MIKPYNIGDSLWYAGREAIEETVTCPECLRNGYLTVTLGDASEVTIPCAGCSDGYLPPKGYIRYWKHKISVSLVTIDRVEINRDYTEYLFDNNRLAKDTDLFLTKDQAEARAKELAEKYNKVELERINKKEKHNRTWAWHVHYYRKMIRNAEKDIERAKTQLAFAESKAHEPNPKTLQTDSG